MTVTDAGADLEGLKSPMPAWFREAFAVPREESFVDSDGCPIHYFRWGDRGDPGLVLVHGNRTHARCLTFVAPLIKGFNVAAYDISGMGDSGARASYPIDVRGREIIAVARACGMLENGGKPMIAAHSLGTIFAISAAAECPDQIGGLILIDGTQMPPEIRRQWRMRGSDAAPEIRDNRVYPDYATALSRFRLSPSQDCQNDYLLEYVGRHSIKPVDGGWSWKFHPSIFKGFGYLDDDAAIFARLSMPRAIINAGKPDPRARMTNIRDETARYINDIAGGAVAVMDIPNAAHHIMMDEPIALATAIAGFAAAWTAPQAVR